MKGGAKPTEKLLLFYKLSFEAEAKTLSLHSASKRSFSKPVSFAGLLPAPAPRGYFLMKRKYPKIHKEPVGSLTSSRHPRGESSFARFSGAMTAKVIFYSLPPRMSLCSILQRASVLTRANAACRNYNFAPDQSAKSCPASSWRYLWYLELLLMLHAR